MILCSSILVNGFVMKIISKARLDASEGIYTYSKESLLADITERFDVKLEEFYDDQSTFIKLFNMH